MASVNRNAGIRIEGLAELRKTARTMDKDGLKLVMKGLRAAMKPVATQASGIVPSRSGRLAASLRPFATGNQAGVRSRVPYGNVIHWGGTTGKGHRPGVGGSGSVKVKPSLFISKAVARNEDQIIDAVGDALERAWVRR